MVPAASDPWRRQTAQQIPTGSAKAVALVLCHQSSQNHTVNVMLVMNVIGLSRSAARVLPTINSASLWTKVLGMEGVVVHVSRLRTLADVFVQLCCVVLGAGVPEY